VRRIGRKGRGSCISFRGSLFTSIRQSFRQEALAGFVWQSARWHSGGKSAPAGILLLHLCPSYPRLSRVSRWETLARPFSAPNASRGAAWSALPGCSRRENTNAGARRMRDWRPRSSHPTLLGAIRRCPPFRAVVCRRIISIRTRTAFCSLPLRMMNRHRGRESLIRGIICPLKIPRHSSLRCRKETPPPLHRLHPLRCRKCVRHGGPHLRLRYSIPMEIFPTPSLRHQRRGGPTPRKTGAISFPMSWAMPRGPSSEIRRTVRRR
jgi:hypothetical protein